MDSRCSYGNPKSVRGELAYTGSQQLLTTGGTLRGGGVRAQVRINVYPDVRFQPFFYAGAGWTRYAVSGSEMLASHDDVLDMPIGFGFGYRRSKFVVDIRFGVDVVTGPDLLADDDSMGSETNAMMHRVGGTAMFGFTL